MPTDELTYFYIFIDFISIIYIFETQQTKINTLKKRSTYRKYLYWGEHN